MIDSIKRVDDNQVSYLNSIKQRFLPCMPHEANSWYRFGSLPVVADSISSRFSSELALVILSMPFMRASSENRLFGPRCAIEFLQRRSRSTSPCHNCGPAISRPSWNTSTPRTSRLVADKPDLGDTVLPANYGLEAMKSPIVARLKSCADSNDFSGSLEEAEIIYKSYLSRFDPYPIVFHALILELLFCQEEPLPFFRGILAEHLDTGGHLAKDIR